MRRWKKTKQQLISNHELLIRKIQMKDGQAVTNIDWAIEEVLKCTPVCACCGESHIEFLTVDHIKNNGSKHKRQIEKTKVYHGGGGSTIHKSMLKKGFNPIEFRVLCYNCNMSRGNKGYCPHYPNEKVKIKRIRMKNPVQVTVDLIDEVVEDGFLQ